MSFTLNIAAHELEPFGRIERTATENPRFEGARLFIDGKAPVSGMLYVCESKAAAQTLMEAGCSAVFVGAESDEPAEAAAFSILGDATALDVFDALLDIASRYDMWERRMDDIFHAQGSLQELLDISEPFLRNNVVVLDPALKLLAYTKSVPCDDPITMALIEHGYHTEDNIRKFKLHRRFKPWSESDEFVINDTRIICKYVTVVKSFKARSAFSLITVMMCNIAAPDAYLLDTYEMFTKRVELYAQRDYPDDKPSGNVVDTFLKDLIGGEIADDEAVVERCRYVGIPHDARFCLFYMKAGENSVPSSRLLADVSLAVAPAKTIVIDDAVVVLCFNCLNDKCALHCIANACPHKRMTVSQRLNEMLERYDLTCGRSSKFKVLSTAPVAYAQAREAYAISRRKFGGAGKPGTSKKSGTSNMWRRIFSFDAYGFDYLVDQLSETGATMLDSTYVGSILDAIARQDAETKTNNYEFLYAYLVHERRTSIVADQLHMHRNNVNYRISRIEEQFEINTDDPALRQDLLLAYRLRAAARAK